jgi:hypothetical protein
LGQDASDFNVPMGDIIQVKMKESHGTCEITTCEITACEITTCDITRVKLPSVKLPSVKLPYVKRATRSYYIFDAVRRDELSCYSPGFS